MATGIQAFAQERYEQIFKHKFNVCSEENQTYYNQGQLRLAAMYCLTLDDKFWPLNWHYKYRLPIERKNYQERVVIAGALLAAEYDRLEYLKTNVLLTPAEIEQDYGNLNLQTIFPVAKIPVDFEETGLPLKYDGVEVTPGSNQTNGYWKSVDRGFSVMCAVYSHGSLNIARLNKEILPLKERFDAGERSDELAHAFDQLEEQLDKEAQYVNSLYYKKYRYTNNQQPS